MINSLIGCVFILTSYIHDNSTVCSHHKEYTRLLDGAGTPEALAILGLNLPTLFFGQVPKEPEETDGPQPDKAHREGTAG